MAVSAVPLKGRLLCGRARPRGPLSRCSGIGRGGACPEDSADHHGRLKAISASGMPESSAGTSRDLRCRSRLRQKSGGGITRMCRGDNSLCGSRPRETQHAEWVRLPLRAPGRSEFNRAARLSRIERHVPSASAFLREIENEEFSRATLLPRFGARRSRGSFPLRGGRPRSSRRASRRSSRLSRWPGPHGSRPRLR